MDANEPTTHRPGSPGKVEILRQRWAQGLPMFHPDDNNHPLEGGANDRAPPRDQLIVLLARTAKRESLAKKHSQRGDKNYCVIKNHP